MKRDGSAWRSILTQKNPIFLEETGESICKLIIENTFYKGETILSLTRTSERCGYLRTGSAHISSYDDDGEETIYEFLNEGDCFGEYFICPLQGQDYHVVADTDCKVEFIHVPTALNGCGRECANHDKLMKIFLLFCSRRSQRQDMHINILSQRTTRAKLLSFFNYSVNQGDQETIHLSMTYASLANYLCVDRSAMMRELKKMTTDGLIETNGHNITLLYTKKSVPEI